MDQKQLLTLALFFLILLLILGLGLFFFYLTSKAVPLPEVSSPAPAPIAPKDQNEELFDRTVDYGPFYTPDQGWAACRFLKSDGQIGFKIDYDVTTAGSFSGAYLKVQDLDLAQVDKIHFRVAEAPDSPLPDRFKIEFKTKSAIARAFAVRAVEGRERVYDFPLKQIRSTPVTEIAIVFEHAKVGPLNQKGSIYLKDFVIE